MRVDKVDMLNIDDLYEAVVLKNNDQDHKNKHFGMNLPQFLSHMTIMFNLSEVSAFEYIFLKRYVGTISKFKENNKDIRSYVKHNFSDIFSSSASPLIDLVDKLNEEYGTRAENVMFPIGFISGTTTIKFSGEALSLIIGLDPKQFFINFKNSIETESTRQHSNDDNVLDIGMKVYFSDESFINYLISTFVNNFYKYMLEKIMYIDPPSDAFNKSMYMDKYKNKVNLLSIQNYSLLINFISDDQYEILNKLNMYRLDHKDENESEILKETRLEFGMKTSLSTFFILFNVLPIEAFTSFESFISVNKYSEDHITDSIPDYSIVKYEKRCLSRLMSFKTDILEKYSDNKANILKKFMLTMNNSTIKYTINLSILDFINILEKIDTGSMVENASMTIYSLYNWCKSVKSSITFKE